MRGIVIVFCHPYIYCYQRRKNPGQGRKTQELPPYPAVSLLEPTDISAETAYHNLEMYGPVAIHELDDTHYGELPAPRILDTYFGDEWQVGLTNQK
jgi:hypothetical protein